MANEVPILGIDLGTTYSCVAYWRDGRAHVISVGNDRTLASYVGFPADDADMDIFVGDEARTETSVRREHLIFDAKRMLGRKFEELTAMQSRWPFKLRKTQMQTVEIEVPSMKGDGKTVWMSPEAISAELLKQLVEAADSKFGERPKEAVITVPAHFNFAQRDATKKAAMIAGLDFVRLVNEPTAAAIAYGAEAHRQEKRTVLVFDLGGGTFDVSLLALQGRQVRVLATTGNDRLGGSDFDQRLLDWVLQEWENEHPGVPCQPAVDIARLNKTLEGIKCGVNKGGCPARKTLRLEDAAAGRELRRVITTEDFDKLNEDLFQLCFRGDADGKGGLDELFGKNGVGGQYNRDNVHEVLLVGGSTKLLRIRALLAEYFPKLKLNQTLDASEAVATGAATLAGIFAEDSSAYKDAEDPPVFVDVLSHSIGVGVEGGNYEVLIPKGHPLPHTIEFLARTVVRGRRYTDIILFEGENPKADENAHLGTAAMTDIELPASGMADLKVELEVDVSGLLNLSVRNVSRGVQGGHVNAEFKVGSTSKQEVDSTGCTQRMQQQGPQEPTNDGRGTAAHGSFPASGVS